MDDFEEADEDCHPFTDTTLRNAMIINTDN